MNSSFRRGNKRLTACALQTYSKIGGLQNFNRRLLENLARRVGDGDDSSVIAMIAGDAGAVIPVVPGLEIVSPRSRIVFFLRSFCSAVFEGDALFVCHINLLPLAAAVRLFRPHMPILLFVHGYEVWNRQGRPRRFHERVCLRALTRIVSVSRYTADVMTREFGVPAAKFRILPNAVDRRERARDAGARRPCSILTVTRLGAGERAKNVHEMLAAVAALRADMPLMRYEIIGDGEMRGELEQLARSLAIDDIVTFRGWVDEEALKAAYASACVFAMPSDKEGFGIVYLEAWQYGLPVICSVHGASSEVVADGVDGFVVNPANIAGLAARLRQLLSNPALAAEMGERGRQKVDARYLNADFRQHLYAILDELATDENAGVLAEGRSQLKL